MNFAESFIVINDMINNNNLNLTEKQIQALSTAKKAISMLELLNLSISDKKDIMEETNPDTTF